MSSSPAPHPLWRSYLAILLPMMLTNVLQSASGTIDGIFLGQLLGLEAIAAVSAFFPVLFLLLAVVIGLSSGATVLIGQAWGAGDRVRVRRVAATAIAMLLSAGAVISLAGGLFTASLMEALGTPAGILSAASLYARVMMIGMPVVFLLWLAASMSRGVGDALSPFQALGVAALLSLGLTPALIEGWLGLPRLGVAAAAVSTITASALALLWLGWRWRTSGHPLAPAWPGSAGIDLRIAAGILRIGGPAAFQMASIAVAEGVLLGLVNRHGAEATAAYGAVNQVVSWVQFPVMSLGITTSILVAHMIGAGRPERIGAIVRTGLLLNLATTGAFVLLAHLCAPVAIGLFITDPAVVAEAVGLLHIVLWPVLLLGGSAVLSGAMRGDGTVLIPTALSVAAIALVELPIAYALEARLGLPGIWWGYSGAFVAMLTFQSLYFLGVWRRRPARRLA